MANYDDLINEVGEELLFAAISLLSMEESTAAHFTIELNEVEFLVSVRKHKDGFYDKLAKPTRKPS